MKKKAFIGLFIIVALTFIGVGYYFYPKSVEEKEHLQKTTVTKQYEDVSSVDNEENIVQLYQEKFSNPDIIGQLSIPNTDLVVPVAQASDNSYYLDHLLDKSQNSLGSVYLDYRNQITDRKLIIYGHNSLKYKTEFHLLENYLNQSYYDQHKDIYFQTLNDSYHYQIFSVYIATKDYQHVNLLFDNTTYQKHLDWMKQQSIYDTKIKVSYQDDILVLQTCDMKQDNAYIIVVAKKVA